MPIRRDEQRTRVTVSAQTIYGHFVTPQHFIGFQPFVQDVREVRWADSLDGTRTVRYQLVESVPLIWGLRVKAVSQVETRLPMEGWVLVQSVKARLGVQLQAVVTITPDGNEAAYVHEQIEVRAPALLIGYVARRVHEALIARHAALRGGYLSQAHP